MEQQPDDFDCESCPVLAALEDLAPENAAAWRVFHQVVSRFGMDFNGMVAWAMGKMTDSMTPDDALDLLERLARIYDALYPAKPVEGDE